MRWTAELHIRVHVQRLELGRFADNETNARERLFHVRSPDEGIIGEAS